MIKVLLLSLTWIALVSTRFTDMIPCNLSDPDCSSLTKIGTLDSMCLKREVTKVKSTRDKEYKAIAATDPTFINGG